MRKNSEIFFSAILVPLDYLMIMLAGLTAYFLRFQSSITEIRPVIYNLPFPKFISWLALGWIGFVGAFGAFMTSMMRFLFKHI